MSSADPFGTAALRAGVLAAWRGSPTRFREDANAESELVLGGYANRALVELAQNAADAAQRAGVPGHLRVTAEAGQLRAANTGAPLDAEGVAALASLRASAKRSVRGSVGQFGVGFSAVLGLTDAPQVLSTTGGVQFSAERTAAELADDPLLSAELRRRDGRPPVLRLVWPAEGEPPPGFDTEVRLPLRPEVDQQALLREFTDEATDLLLALPWLECVEIGPTRLRREGEDPVLIRRTGAATTDRVGGDGTAQSVQCWRVVRRSGVLPPEVLADLGAEARPEWALCWALPVDADGTPRPYQQDVLHAPTPTAERVTVPARLVATVPVDVSRQHVHVGSAADRLFTEAAAAYPDLAEALAPQQRTALVPRPGFPASEVDAVLRERVLDALRAATWLPTAGGGRCAPADALVLDTPLPELAALLADAAPGLLDAELAAPGHATALAALGVRRLRPGALVELLSGLRRPPEWWWRCYAALTPLLDSDPAAREELGALPVPLADGRTVTGPRGALIGDLGVDAATTSELRLVHPDAVHPLLERLGAQPAGPDELLDALRPAVERSLDDAEDGMDVSGLVAAVLALAERAEPRAWLGALALPDEQGEPRRADELVLPQGRLRAVLAEDAPLGVLHPDLAAAHPAAALRAVGVLDGFAVLDEPEPAGPDHELDGEEDWWAELDQPPDRLLAVRDLDLVDDRRWPAALRIIAADPAGLAALREPGGYTGWWLARNARFAGRPPTSWRLPGADDLAGLYDPVPVRDLDERLLGHAGVRSRLAVTCRADAEDLIDRLADPDRQVSPAVVFAAHTALATAAARLGLDPDDLDPPKRVRAMTGAVLDAERAAVLDEPWLAALLPAEELVAGGDPADPDADPATLADLLDLPLASELLAARHASPQLLDPAAGRLVRWSDLVEVVMVCAAAGWPLPRGELWLHERLRVRHRGAEVTVPFWVTSDGAVHASDPVRALLLLGP